MTSAAAKRGPLLRLAWVSGLLLAAFVAVELAFRGWLAFEKRAWDSDATRARIERSLAGADEHGAKTSRASEDAATVLHPFFARDTRAARKELDRALEFTSSAEGTLAFDVVVFGGAAAADFATNRVGPLTEALRADPRYAARPIRVWNQARAGFKQPQQANALAYLLDAGVEPDLVLVIDGVEDLTIALRNGRAGTHPVYPSTESWGSRLGRPLNDPARLQAVLAARQSEQRMRSWARTSLSLGLAHSACLGTFVVDELERRLAEVNAAQRHVDDVGTRELDDRAAVGPRHAGDDIAIVRTATRAWFEGALSMWAMCRERGIAYVHVLETAPHDADVALAQGERSLAGGLRELEKRGVPIVDARAALEASKTAADEPRDLGAAIVRAHLAALDAGDARR
ncbi:MAG: hypothetical protein K8S98_08310 [Planctomycetes bacterium]|nr:hypothetical protein [Planctomycetota bacterium]